MNDEPIITQQTESVKLMKMSKGYNWEIKLIGDVPLDDVHSRIGPDEITRLGILNNQLQNKYGGEEK